ncbi:Hypothetical protein, putative [Bodo saltans]|uniref:Uncharacterized protein n=1 Tax=Bodo saltans TaxID=75058 RepID=A0A0S4IJX1_BODSA|nr:Hypothetical protein, putative [Bodo saltans]|eukprot:CUE95722.1 Hypothetical protein, putative [Bodo saltans]
MKTMYPKHNTSFSQSDAMDMSGGLRDRGDFKRNVAHNNNINSSSCTARSGVERCSLVERDVRAQNLKALQANYPHERAKIQRLRDVAFRAIDQDQERVRARIMSLCDAEYGVLRSQLSAESDQATLATTALDLLETIAHEEYNARLRLLHYHRRSVPLLTLRCQEYHDRCDGIAQESTEFREIVRLHFGRCDVLETYETECTNRCIVLDAESRSRATLRQSYYEHFQCVESALDDVRALTRACSAGREEVVEEEATYRSRIADHLITETRRMDACMAQRYRLYSDAENAFRAIIREHTRHVSCMKEELANCLEQLAERVAQHESQVECLIRTERGCRMTQEELEFEDRSIITHEMARGIDDVHTAAAAKAAERQEFVRDAMADCSHYGLDALEGHRLLFALEQSERNARKEWISHRHSEQRNLMDLAVSQIHFLYDDFTRELMVLWDAMQVQQDDVLLWMEEKQQSREAFVADVYQHHGRSLFAEQQDIRRQLYDRMLDEEEELFKWLDLREEELNVVAGKEMDCRRALDRFEDVSRTKLHGVWDDLLQAMQHREHLFWSGVESLEAAAGESNQNLVYDEAVAWELVLQRAEQSYLLAFERQHFREAVEMERIESHDRRAIDLDAMRATELIILQQAHQRREMNRLQEEAFLDARTAVESEEANHRTYFADTCRSQWSVLLLDAAKDKEISLENEMERLKEERYRKHEYYLEDSRLYDPDEEPLPESKMNMIEFRRSVHADLMLDAYSGRKSCGGVPVAKWSEADSRREFLSQALRGFNTSRLPAEVVDLLTNVVSDLNDAASAEVTQRNNVIREVERIKKTTAQLAEVVDLLTNVVSDLNDAASAEVTQRNNVIREVERIKKTTAQLRDKNVKDREKHRGHEERNKRAEVESQVHMQNHKDRMAKVSAAIRRDEEKLKNLALEHRALEDRIYQKKEEKKSSSSSSSAFTRLASTQHLHKNPTVGGGSTSMPFRSFK